MIRAIWSLVTQLAVTFYQATRVVLAAMRGVKQTRGGLYDRAAREWGLTQLKLNGVTYRVEGLERLEPGAPYVFLANHLSWVDVWLLAAILPDSMRFVAKKELLRVPIFGMALRAAGHILIDRKNLTSAFSAYDEAARAIQAGMSAAIFVEGHRTRDGALLPFKKGPFVLAISSGVPVVPVLIEGTFEVMPAGSIAVRPGPIRIAFGEPIPTAGLTYDDRDNLSERTRQAMIALAKTGNRERGTGNGTCI